MATDIQIIQVLIFRAQRVLQCKRNLYTFTYGKHTTCGKGNMMSI